MTSKQSRVRGVDLSCCDVLTGGVAGRDARPVPGYVHANSGSWYTTTDKTHGSAISDAACCRRAR